MPHAHAILIAAIFVPYMAFMVGLGAYIWSTGRPRPVDGELERPESDRKRSTDPEDLVLAV
jgi:hypothetical protein